MNQQLVCLTLIVPHRLREEVFDHLSAQADLVPGFSASHIAGHGVTVRLYSAAEQVKGHADQAMVQVVLASADAGRLLDRVREAFAGARLVYWLTPVSEFGVID